MNNNDNLPKLPDGAELIQSKPTFLAEDEWWDIDVDDEVLDVTKEYPIRYSLSINGTPFAPLGGLHGMTGQPGHGKTMTLSMVAAAVLGDKNHGMEWLLTEDIPQPSVLYIDTEMEKGNTMLVNKRICAMLGWDWHTAHEQLTILCLREVVTAQDRWRKVLKAIYKFKPTVVILDGLIDVVADFNDNTDCQQLIFKCMATASHYDISFWTLLHENPGSTKMVGHAGSFLERKASDVMVTKKSKDEVTGEVTFELTNKKVRAADWEGYLFKVDGSVHKFGVPMLVNKDFPQQEEQPPLSVEELMRSIIKKQDGITTRDLLQGVKSALKVGASKAEKVIWEAEDDKIIYRDERKRYYLADNSTEQLTMQQNDECPY